MNAPDRAALRLTQFSHGGGCGCKIAPAALQEIIAKTGRCATRAPHRSASGGLLAAWAPDAVDEVLGVFRNEGFERATAIGRIVPGIPQVTVV